MTTGQSDGTTLERGMLLIGPGSETASPCVWCVSSSGVLIAHSGGCIISATLRRRGKLPKGWRVINNATLADLLAAEHC